MTKHKMLIVAALSSLAMASISGCSTTTVPKREVVIQVEYLPMLPPPALLSPCNPPFDKPPLTHGEKESAIRDMTWVTEFKKCAARPDEIKKWYQNKQADK